MLWASRSSGHEQKLPSKRIKIKPLLFVALFGLTFLSSTFMSTQDASAAIITSKSKVSDPDWQVKSLLYYRAIGHCLTYSSMKNGDGATTGGRIDNTNIATGLWFGIGSTNFVEAASPAGPYLKSVSGVGDDGKVNCGEESKSLIFKALEHWGISGKQLLCNIGMIRVDMGASQSIDDCISASNQLERPSGAGSVGWSAGAKKFKEYISKTIYGLKNLEEPGLLDHEWYVYYKKAIANSCIPNITNKPDSGKKGDDNQLGYNNVKWVDVDEDKKENMVKEGSYNGDKKKTDTITTRPKASKDNFDEYNLTCAEMVTAMNSFADEYATWAFANRAEAKDVDADIITDTEELDDEDATSCIIPGIGWMICPAFNFLAGVTDSTYEFIQGLLVVDTSIVLQGGATYNAWSVIRTFANVGFVIVFLIIIFSQLTGVGVSNYGVKKLLPRIVVAAILVNVSFLITQLAVDLSNILGGTLNDLLRGIDLGDKSLEDDFFATGNMFTEFTTGVFAGTIAIGGVAAIGTAAYFAGPSLLIPILLAAVLAVIITLFILIARQAVIILLIILSPLAFLAMLLPNTETFFKQWRKIFISLLLVYPAIALLFGGSYLASGVLFSAFTDGDQNLMGQLVALAVMVLPLFAVIPIIQGSLKAVPALGNLAGKLSSRANGLIGKQSKQGFARSTFGQSMAIRRKAKDAYRMQKFARNASVEGSLANVLAKEPPITAAQKYANQTVQRTASSIAQKERAEDIQAAELKVEGMQLGQVQMRAVSMGKGPNDAGKDSAVQAAAIRSVVQSNDVRGMNELWDQSKTWTGAHGDEMRNVLAKSMEGSSGRPAWFGAGAIAQLKLNGHDNSKTTMIGAVKAGAYSPAKIAAADKDELHALSEAVDWNTDPSLLPVQQKLVNDAHTALSDPELKRTMGKNLERVIQIRDGKPPAGPLA